MSTLPIDLRSDTVTRPSAAMRRAMAEAEVGDDERDGDPTMRRLEARVASLLGMDRALFFPSGVMANQTGLNVLSRPGTEVLLDADAHIIHWEMAGAAALSGVQVRPVPASGAVMSAADLRRALRPPSRYAPAPSVVCLENTHNGAGGKVTSLFEMQALCAVARDAGLPVHLDGARLWNAAVATGDSPAALAAGADTVMVDFSKGLGAPIGAALAMRADLADAAWTTRKRFGGAMRQSGHLAAAALYALDENLPSLAADHSNARLFAAIIGSAGGVTVIPPDTNIVMIDLPPSIRAESVVVRAREEGILISAWSPTRLRAVTHLDVDEPAVRRAGDVVRALLDAGAK